MFAEKIKILQALRNEANKKVAAKNRRKIVPSMDQLMAGSGPGSTSGPMVVLEEGDHFEERVQEPVRRRRLETPSKEPATPIKATPLCYESGDFLQLPKYGPSLIVVVLMAPFSSMTLSCGLFMTLVLLAEVRQ